MIRFLSIALMFFSLSAIAQKHIFLDISPKVGGNPALFGGGVMTDLNGVAFNIDFFDYYLSNVRITHDGGQVTSLGSDVYLIEPDNHQIYLGYVDVQDIESINFGIGVPSNLNTISGADAIDISAYPAGHPLYFQDPSMHWGWSSGYMFMIIGGDADKNNDGVPDGYYDLAPLGDQNYAEVTIPVIETNTTADQIDIYMDCNIDVWLTDVQLVNTATQTSIGQVHSTTGVCVTIMKNPEINDVFTQPLTANAAPLDKLPGKVWFSNTSEGMTINWEGVRDLGLVSVLDVRGRMISSNQVTGIVGNTLITDLSAGSYQVLFTDVNGGLIRTLNVAR